MVDKPTRQAFGEALLELGRQKSDFVVLDADISKSTYSYLFHQEFPERSYNFGIAEQNMFGIAAGFATTGIPVFATTYAVFASMRAIEQIRTFICYPELNVKVIASHGGLQVSSDGASHQGIEDLAIMRSLPNMTVVQPADSQAMRRAVFAAAEYDGPMYIRLLRNAVPDIYDDDMKFEIGKGNIVKDHQDCECTIISTGLMVGKALQAARVLKDIGINVRVVDIHTIKPIDKKLIVESAQKTGAIVTAEDHNIIGGLGGAVAEIMGQEEPVPIEIIGIKDVYGESGDPEVLFSEYEMNTEHIVKAVKKAIDRKKLY